MLPDTDVSENATVPDIKSVVTLLAVKPLLVARSMRKPVSFEALSTHASSTLPAVGAAAVKDVGPVGAVGVPDAGAWHIVQKLSGRPAWSAGKGPGPEAR